MKAYLEIEMPTSCGSCLFRRLWPEDDEVECIIEKKLWTKDADKNPACPLVPVPPHGRLIDADALIERMKLGIDHFTPMSRFDEYMLCGYEAAVIAIRECAPTIIPAEEPPKEE